MEYIKKFTELYKNDAEIAGGKGASLGEMINNNIPVPDGYVVTADTFDFFLKETDLFQEIDTIIQNVDHKTVSSVEHASEKIQGLVTSVEVPLKIQEEILEAFGNLDSEYVAVRSSATAEDGAEHAWAGQLESYLNVTKEALVKKVQHCWSSLFTPRAIQYRFEKDLHSTHISVAVVVQKMVNAEKSGIAFSVHPVTENRNQMIIEAGLGLGESIVSGAITPDSYVITKDKEEIIDINVNKQKKALYRDDKGGNTWVNLAEDKASIQVLGEHEILELGKIIKNIEKHYGFPCDIEWSYEDGTFYIVQSRPITTLKSEETPSTVVWEKVLQRNFPPLGWTAGGHYEFNGLNVGPMNWVREREMHIKYKVVQSYMIQDPNAYYTSNITELIEDIDTDFDMAIDENNAKVMEMVEVFSGDSLLELKKLNTQHKLSYGLMLIGFDVAIDIKERIDVVVKSKSDDFEAYLATPWKPTAVQREQIALEDIRKQIAENPDKKEELLEKMEIDFGYIHQDYVGKPWGKEDYETALSDGITLHSGMTEEFDDSRLSDYEKWLISIFKKMTYMYEEGRNAMVRCAWAMKATVEKLGHNPSDLLYMTASEVDVFSESKADFISKDLVSKRKEAFALHFDDGKYTEYSGNEEVESLIQEQGVAHLWEIKNESIDELKGSIAYKGYAKGRARIVFTQEDSNKIEEGEILISPMTQVEFLSGIRKCAAIVTDEGGIICHAAIVSREFGKPCILATNKATQVIKTGDLVEVDANAGIVRLIKE